MPRRRAGDDQLAEIYTALQTHVVGRPGKSARHHRDQKFYQVQKYCSLTNHMWVGYWMLVNGAFWAGLPEDHRKIIDDAFNAQALEERVANQKLDDSLEDDLKRQGMDVQLSRTWRRSRRR